MTSLTFYSPQLPDGSTAPQEFEFNGFGCNGRNQSPALVWADVPLEARSLALTAYDPDAPTGSGWWHWFVVDLPLGAALHAALIEQGLPLEADSPPLGM